MDFTESPTDLGLFHGPHEPLVVAVGVGPGGAELMRALARRLPDYVTHEMSTVDEARIAEIVRGTFLTLVAEDDASPPDVGAAIVRAARAAQNCALRVGPVSRLERRHDDGRLLLARGTRLFDAVQGFVDSFTKSGIVGFDHSEIRDRLHPGPVRAAVGIGETGVAAARAAVDSWTAEERMHCAAALLLIEMAGSGATLRTLVEMEKAVEEAIHPDADISFSASISLPPVNSFRITVLLAGEAQPSAEVR